MDNLTSYRLSRKSQTHHFGYNIESGVNSDISNYLEALKYFNKAIEINHDNYVAYFNRANIRMKLGDFDGARVDFMRSEIFDTSRSIYE